MRAFLATALTSLLLGSLPALAQQAADSVAPEIGTAQAKKQAGEPVRGKKWMVAIANPYAAQAAADVLRSEGSAIDAAVAAQLVLGLVEPQSSGLGGGAFLVYFDAVSGHFDTVQPY